MNKMIKSLLASALACTSVSAAIDSGKTFIAHRDELANIGMEWTNTNHLAPKKEVCSVDPAAKKGQKNAPKKCVTPFGASMTATGFYGESTNKADLATLFGMGTTGAIKVTPGLPAADNDSLPGADTIHTTLYNTNIQLSPNSDGSSLNASAGTNFNEDPDEADTAQNRVPAHGTVKFAPKRQVYGAHLGWNQSLDAVLDGLSFSVRAPIVQVRSSMNPTTVGEVKASVPVEDGKSGNGLLDYFNGKLTNTIDGTNLNVNQSALAKNKFGANHNTVTGLADLEIAVQYAWNCAALKCANWSLGAVVQIPTGKKPDAVNLFESQYGARGHVAAGAKALAHFDAYTTKDITVGFDIAANWKYFFKGTEVRTMGIYDVTNKVMLPASQYRLVMTHGITGVQPAANVLALEHDVTPGHQIDALAGMSVSWKNFTFDLGYNLYWHQAEKVVQKASWTNDKFALAHPHYSMRTTALGQYVIGGTSYLDGDAEINHLGGTIGDNDTDLTPSNYDDVYSPVDKHGYYIGANGDSGGTTLILSFDELSNVAPDFAGAFTSVNGPIQKSGVKTSALTKRIVDGADDEGVDIADTGTLDVHYNVSSLPATTALQLTHSIVAGVSYKVPGNYPIIIGVGGQAELQESSRNSALEGFKVWAKFGISF